MATPSELLIDKCEIALAKLKKGKEYKERLDYELSVINKLGYADYFLIVADIVNWARERMFVGPGRGSAVGSLVAYLLNITTIDPLKFNLLFERFLTPDRVSPPDIDVDFTDREAVVEYCRGRFGNNKVVNIGTWNYYKSKNAIQDACRVLGISRSLTLTITKQVVEGSIDEILKDPKLLAFLSEHIASLDPALQQKERKLLWEMFTFAKYLEGKIRHQGAHAAGIVISQKPVGAELPLMKMSRSDDFITQWPMKAIESLGYLKVDILHIDNLCILNDVSNLIGNKIDIYNVPLNDVQTLAEFNKGNTVGIFQLESPESVDMLRKIKINNFSDIYNIVAAIRPGLDREKFMYNHEHMSEMKFDIPQLKEILSSTCGVILYQEQVMQIVMKLGNFTPVEADQVRREIAKSGHTLHVWEEKFVAGCVANNVAKGQAEELWESILACQKYIFNLSHGVAYSHISYYCMYLKVHFPIEFLVACLNNDKNAEKYIYEAKRLKIKVLPPDINKSKQTYTVENGAIRVGFGAIKHVGKAGEFIMNHGPYKSFVDFGNKISRRVVRRNVIDSLILSGCFNAFENRGQLWASIHPDLNYSEQALLQMEYGLLGYYITGDPFSYYKEFEKVYRGGKPIRNRIKIGGFILSVHNHMCRNGEMAFVKLRSPGEAFDAIIWPNEYATIGHKLIENAAIIADGNLTEKGNYSLEKVKILSQI